MKYCLDCKKWMDGDELCPVCGSILATEEPEPTKKPKKKSK